MRYTLTAAFGIMAVILAGCGGSSPGDWITSPTGLRYRDITVGTGDQTFRGVKAVVNMSIKLENGTEVYKTTSPAYDSFRVGMGEFPPGVDEGMTNMRIGGRRLMTLPPEIGFGSEGKPSHSIPPNATITYDIQLLHFRQSSLSGLQWDELEVGAGGMPGNGSRVRVHYTGWLTDGTKFDSSYDRNEPFEFTTGTGEVIDGWDEGVRTMRVGGKRRLIIPSKLGYKDVQHGDIPPDSTLIFEVELLAIMPPIIP